MKRLIAFIAALGMVLIGPVSSVLAEQAMEITDEGMDRIVAGSTDTNTLAMTGDAQRYFKGLSNVNTVDSASAVQSNIVSGGSSNDTPLGITNKDGYDADTEGRTVKNTLTLTDNAQNGEPVTTDADEFFAALSNVNTVDSANAVQSNISTGSGISTNDAEVVNSDTGDDYYMTSNNMLGLDLYAQKSLWALSNLNTVDSANAVQSNISTAGFFRDSYNHADVRNRDGGGMDRPGPHGRETTNTLSLVYQAQMSLEALSNLNTVDSANAVQSNITVGGLLNLSENCADLIMNRDGRSDGEVVVNNSLSITNQAQRALVALSNLNTVDSANAVQSNINVGTWLGAGNSNYADVTNTGGKAPGGNNTGGITSSKVTTNTLTLDNWAQSDLTALSNLNTVDSANAVQSNINVGGANVSSNEADVLNHNGYTNEKGVMTVTDMTVANTLSILGEAQHDLTALSNLNTVDSANAVQSNINIASCVSDNDATVENNDGSADTYEELNSVFSLGANVQGALCALSNVNTVDSANAVQSNITSRVTSRRAWFILNSSTNNADVDNIDPDTSGDPTSNNIMELGGSAQNLLTALSNVNSIDSANAVQSSITANDVGSVRRSISNSSDNYADVKNDGGSGRNEVTIVGTAQQGLTALSNLNTAASANAVQSNITTNLIGSATAGEVSNTSANSAYVNNTTGAGDNKLQLGGIPEPDNPDFPLDGTPDPGDSPQANLCALSNINTVDSANAVQSNITATKGDIEDSLFNDSSNCAIVEVDGGVTPRYGDQLNMTGNAQQNLCALSNLNTVNSANAVQSNITISCVDVGKREKVSNTSTNCAYVKNNRAGAGDGGMSDPKNFYRGDGLWMSGNAQQNLSALSNLNAVESATAVQSNITTTCCTGRWDRVNNTSSNCAHVENVDESKRAVRTNDLGLSGFSQQNLTALSNINSVSSATAVQSNITMSSGRGSSFSTNSAYVSNINNN